MLLSHFATVLLKILTLQFKDIVAICRALARFSMVLKKRRQLKGVVSDSEILSYFTC